MTHRSVFTSANTHCFDCMLNKLRTLSFSLFSLVPSFSIGCASLLVFLWICLVCKNNIPIRINPKPLHLLRSRYSSYSSPKYSTNIHPVSLQIYPLLFHILLLNHLPYSDRKLPALSEHAFIFVPI